MQQFQVFRRRATRARTKHGTVFGPANVPIILPLFRFFQAFDDMLSAETLGDKILRVPTFYSAPNDDGGAEVVLGLCVSIIVFGAIHCIAWSFHFVTLPER